MIIFVLYLFRTVWFLLVVDSGNLSVNLCGYLTAIQNVYDGNEFV